MGGGLLQLVAYGAQDAYLSGNPQITFWKGLFKRHTNFAMEPFRVNLTGQPSWGTKHAAILGRHADLIASSYIEVELENDEAAALLDGAGGNLVNYVELDIGGQVIDRQYGEFMYLWGTLTFPTDKRNLWGGLQTIGGNSDPCGLGGRPKRAGVTYIPLQFFFCRNPGMALPLIALQYHEVKINILWNEAKLIFDRYLATESAAAAAVGKRVGDPKNASVGPKQANLLVDYVYLDVEERRRMAQESHEYLIEQTQFNEDKGLTSGQNRVDLTFNHPVKELIWITQRSANRDCRLAAADTQITPLAGDSIIYDCSIQLNGQDRVPSLPGTYFRLVQPYQHHSGAPLGGLYMYSFAIRPEEHQPSGTCNFSRIDTATIVFSVDGNFAISNADSQNYDIRVYAINYNILRIMSGMGGLAYSN
jgi:hypothetical protein